MSNADPTQFASWTGSAAGVAAGLFVLARWIFRRVSRDGVEVAKDRAETDVINTLQQQLANANARADELARRTDQFARERNDAIGELFGLRREVALLRQQVQHQNQLLRKLVDTLFESQQLEQILQSAGIDVSELTGTASEVPADAPPN